MKRKKKKKINKKHFPCKGQVTSNGNFYNGYSGGAGRFTPARNIDGELSKPKEVLQASLYWLVWFPIILACFLVMLFIGLFVFDSSLSLWIKILMVLSPFCFYLITLPMHIYYMKLHKEAKRQLKIFNKKKQK